MNAPTLDRPRAAVTAEPLTYSRDSPHSYFRDLLRLKRSRERDAEARLQRHAREMDIELPRVLAAREARAAAESRRLFGDVNAFEQRANPSRTDGQGGYFVPPLWLVEAYAGLARAGRPFASLVTAMPLPAGTDSINVPKVASGGAVTVQPLDGSAVSSVDLTDTFVTAPVRTIAGQADVAMQLADQTASPGWDLVVFAELAADYGMKLDAGCLSGTGTAGQLLGLDNVSGTNAVTYTDATPTGPELAAPVGQAAALIATRRLLMPTHYLMHARRWFWLCSQLDTSNRPLVTPDVDADLGPVGGLVGSWMGLPIVADQNVTVTGGAGANEDRIYAVRASDCLLWESIPRLDVITEALSGTLSARFRFAAYAAFMPGRYPVSISIVSGTGLAGPAGYGP